MAATSRIRRLLASLRALPETERRLAHLEHDHQLLIEHVRRIESKTDQTYDALVSADPQRAFDIVSAVRDDVRSLLVEVTEQSNRVAAQLDARDGAHTQG